ncbi:MAG: tripartite tricarboxylate transporter substrate binding protein [Hyphomicrobiales bacterium]|nr:MAG: tripartite tricarboxylate transporter substrate binding protein [Hyphomicrobiales bacterium]
MLIGASTRAAFASLVRTFAAFALAMSCASGAALGQTAAEGFPSKLITIVVTFGAGSASDVNARFYVQALKDTLGATAVVDIRPGANGMIGARVVANAAPDGYTVLMGSGTANAANYALYADRIAYKPQQFETVAMLYISPTVLYTTNEIASKTVQGLKEEATRTGRKLNCGSGNAISQVACEVLRIRLSADIVNVAYRGNAQSLSDLVGGHISLAFADVTAAEGMVNSGLIRPLAVAGSGRLATSPDVQTFAEQGIANFDFTAWNGLFVPAGTPPEIIEKLNRAARHMLATPEWEKQRTLAGGQKVSGDLRESQDFVSSEIAKWERYARESNIKPE